MAWSNHSQRGAAHARQAPVLRLLPRDSQRGGAQAHYTRKPAHEVDAAAGTWKHGLPTKKGGLSLVQCPSIGHEAITASAARRARAVTARARALRLLPRDIQRGGAQARYARKPAPEMSAAAGT